jgi:outer membrane protein OmpA-like peptidoglycan-associated protein
MATRDRKEEGAASVRPAPASAGGLGPEALAAASALRGTSPGPLSPQAVLELQQQIGNASLQRALLQRQHDAGTAVAGVPDAAAPPAGGPALAKATFPYVSTRSPGERFDSEYVPVGPAPAVGTLNVSLWVHITFAPFTRAMMRRPEFRGHRWTPEQMRDFAWTDAEKETFETGFMTSVMDAWSGKHTLHLDDPDFSEYRCKVNVDVMTIDNPGAAHVKMTAQKVPTGAPRFRSFVRGNEATLDIRDPTEPETRDDSGKEVVRQIGPFALDGADLTSDLEGQIAELVGKLRPLQSPTQTSTLLGDDWAVDFVGRASAPGTRAHNETLGKGRADAVENRVKADLGRPGVPSRATSVGEEHASEDPKFQRVDVSAWNVPKAFATPGATVTQNTAAHEAGHMFGLGDEYVDETPPSGVVPKFMGDKPSHYGDVEALMGTDAANELLVQDSGSMMSQGSEVHRGHYVYFLQALNGLTGKRWEVE